MPETVSETVHDKITLFWKEQKFIQTVPLGSNDNVATFTTLVDGYKSFEAFCAEVSRLPTRTS
jgi:hypothetical protein